METTFRRRATDMIDQTNGLSDSQRLIIIQNALIEANTKLEKHHKILLEGNGELPLVEKVRNLETFVDTLKFWLRTVSVAIVIQTVTFGAAALIYFIKLYPILQQIARNP